MDNDNVSYTYYFSLYFYTIILILIIVTRDELIKETVKALHGCLEPGKEFDLNNTSIAIVGHNERFHVLEGEELAPYIAGLGAAQSSGMVVEEETSNVASTTTMQEE